MTAQTSARTTGTNARPAAPNQRRRGLPTWSVTSIQAAALVTGLIFSLLAQAVGAPYLIAFALGAFATTLLVEARGLFLTVVQIPILFAIMTPVTAWLVQNATQPEGRGADFSTTGLLGAVFPVATFFPVLLAVTLGCAFLATLRYVTARRKDHNVYRDVVETRRRINDSDRENVATTTRVRARTRRALEDPSRQVTVDELLKKRREQPGARRRTRDSASRGTHQGSAASAAPTSAGTPTSTGTSPSAAHSATGARAANDQLPQDRTSVSRADTQAIRRTAIPRNDSLSHADTPRPSSAGAGSTRAGSQRPEVPRTYVPRSATHPSSTPTPTVRGKSYGSYRRVPAPDTDTPRAASDGTRANDPHSRIVRPPSVPRRTEYPARPYQDRPQVRRTAIPRDPQQTPRPQRAVQQPPQKPRQQPVRKPFLDEDLFDS